MEKILSKISLDKLDNTTKELKVTFLMNKDNELVSACKPDEFFVCTYHFTNTNKNNNNDKIKSIFFDKQNNATHIDYFDCNEGASNLQLL